MLKKLFYVFETYLLEVFLNVTLKTYIFIIEMLNMGKIYHNCSIFRKIMTWSKNFLISFLEICFLFLACDASKFVLFCFLNILIKIFYSKNHDETFDCSYKMYIKRKYFAARYCFTIK